MSKKLKKKLYLLIADFIMFALAVIITHIFDLGKTAEIIIFGCVYVFCAYPVLRKAFLGVIHLQMLDENFLMTIASVGAFAIGDYLESVSVILFYLVGDWFEAFAVGKSRGSIAKMMDIRPETARLVVDGIEKTVFPEEVKLDDVLLVKPGEKIPVDCEVISGESYIDTSFLTGESMPVFVKEGDMVSGGAINKSGVLTLRAKKLYTDSAVAKVLQLVETASAKKAKAENFITKFARIYTPAVVGGAVLLFIIPSIITGHWTDWLYRALTFLVVSCPCALVISIPLGFFGGIGNASRYGILVKGSSYIEQLSKANIYAFDKTGTLTEGKLHVLDITPAVNKTEILKIAGICESGSTHPIAQSILKECKNIESGYAVTEISGKGIKAEKNGNTLLCGNEKLMAEFGIEVEEDSTVGTHVYVAENGKYVGTIVVGDKIRDDAKQTIADIKALGGKTFMLTGDCESVAESVATEVGLDEYKSSLLPENKVQEVENIIANKKPEDVVVYVGDGINDAPVLTRADVGIAMGGVGSDAAIEAADVVFMYDNIRSLSIIKKISMITVRIVKENIIFALAVKFGVLILSAFGLASMWLALFADVGVAVLAILNAMRTGLKLKEKKRSK